MEKGKKTASAAKLTYLYKLRDSVPLPVNKGSTSSSSLCTLMKSNSIELSPLIPEDNFILLCKANPALSEVKGKSALDFSVKKDQVLEQQH